MGGAGAKKQLFRARVRSRLSVPLDRKSTAYGLFQFCLEVSIRSPG